MLNPSGSDMKLSEKPVQKTYLVWTPIHSMRHRNKKHLYHLFPPSLRGGGGGGMSIGRLKYNVLKKTFLSKNYAYFPKVREIVFFYIFKLLPPSFFSLEMMRCCWPTCRSLDQGWAPQEDGTLLANDDALVGHGGNVGAARRTGPQDHGNLINIRYI